MHWRKLWNGVKHKEDWSNGCDNYCYSSYQCCSKRTEIGTSGENKYIGAWVTSNVDNEKEIKTRIGKAKGAFWKQVLMRGNLNIELKKRLLNSYVFSLSSYRYK